MAGSFLPFAKTRAERERNGDPRLSIEERYASRAEYLRRVEEVANQLEEERFLLKEHVKVVVDAAGQHWDYLMGAKISQNGK
jgi:hypothetical protein